MGGSGSSYNLVSPISISLIFGPLEERRLIGERIASIPWIVNILKLANTYRMLRLVLLSLVGSQDWSWKSRVKIL
jgi:hypothetical protein